VSTTLVLALALAAQAPPPETGLRDMNKPRLAIMALAAQGVPEEYALGLTETIATGIARTGVFETLSPRQVSSILSYEKRKDALGACADEACYTSIARAVKAAHLIGGSVSKVGDQLVLDLILIDATTGKALERGKDTTTEASDLVERAYRTAIIVLQPLLSARQGYLDITSNVADAAVKVNDVRRSEGIGQAIALPAGPHVVEVSKDGFYAAITDISIQPGAVTTQRITLIPAKETIAAYESKATWMRAGAYGASALAVGATVLAAVMFNNASLDADRVEAFVARPDIERTAALREEAVGARSDFEVGQGLYLGAMGAAVIFGASAIYLFLAGDDPDRYAEFRDVDP